MACSCKANPIDTNNSYITGSLYSRVPATLDEQPRVPFPDNGLQNNTVPFNKPSVSVHAIGSSRPSTDHQDAPTEEFEASFGSCGYCCWTPKWLQKLASARFFVLFLSLLSLIEAGLTVGYISGMVTSFELQFRFNSTLTGFVVSCYDIGTLVVIFTSYFGGRAVANRPKWIAWSGWIMALGSSIVTLPHFFISYKSNGNGTDLAAVCHRSINSSESNSWVELNCGSTEDGLNIQEGPEWFALACLIPGILLIGVGSTATVTLGTTYIDDFVRTKETPILLAIFFSTTVIGPALGFVIGSFVLNYYVDFDTVPRPSFTQSSPRWVGAWWLGFFFFAGAILIMAFPVYAFPAKLKKPPKGVEEDKHSKEEDEEDDRVQMTFRNADLKNIPLAVWGLLTNPVYMMVNVASAAEFSIVTGFVRFVPKFVQSQFDVDAAVANLITGTLIPAGALGVIVGGFILNRVKQDLMATVNVLTVLTLISGLAYGFLYLPGPCDNLPMAGVSTSYKRNDPNWHRPFNSSHVNLTSECNAQCHCDATSYSPVCGSNGVVYFNPCFAGCEDKRLSPTKNDHDNYEYFNCTCVEDYEPGRQELAEPFWEAGLHYNMVINGSSEATSDLCTSNCSTLPLFVVTMLVIVFFSSTAQVPALLTVLRSVKREEKPFALGLQFVILRLFGFIPSPVYYGAVIDSTCILWQQRCSGDDGACLQYDNPSYYYRYLGLSTGVKTISVGMAIFVWIVVRRMQHGRERMESLVSVESTTSTVSTYLDDSESNATWEKAQPNDWPSQDIAGTSGLWYTSQIDRDSENVI